MTNQEAMKLALEALMRIENSLVYSQPISGDEVDEAITALEEALAKQEQGEPVAEYIGNNPDELDLSKRIGLIHRLKFIPLRSKLYTTPQQRKPLTDEEIEKCYETTGHYQTLRPQDRFVVFALARAIEAAHGIKE
jgi:hypothetical protein